MTFNELNTFLKRNHLEKWSIIDYCDVAFGKKAHFFLGQIKSVIVTQNTMLILLTAHKNADENTTPPYGRNIVGFSLSGEFLWYVQSASNMYPHGMKTSFLSIRQDESGAVRAYDGSCEAKIDLATGKLFDVVLTK